MSKVLITGGAGFIGRWLAKRCIEAGDTVYIVDNLSVGRLKNRDCIYVEDVAEGFYRLGNCPHAVEVFNLESGTEYSVQEVVDIISQELREKLSVVQDPTRMRAVDKPHQYTDVTHLEAVLGWRPVTSLREGIRRWLQHEGLIH